MRHDRFVLSWNAMVLVSGLAIGAGLSTPALGQNALGDGRGLEANTRQGSGGRNYRIPSFEKEVQFRNAIATGNAPGGVSFRGDLGYSAPGEFAGSLGSDSLYSFRRDSLYSGLAGMGIRGTDALQYQFSMTTGSRPTQGLTGNLLVSRFDGASSASFGGGIGYTGDPISINPAAALKEAQGRVSGTLRSTSSYASTSGLMPELITTYELGIEKDQFGLIASPLMGLVSTPMNSGQSGAGTRVDNENRVPAKTSYDDLVEQIRTRATTIRERGLPEDQDPADPSNSSNPANPSSQGNQTEQGTDDWISQRLSALQRNVLGLPEPVQFDEEAINSGSDNPPSDSSAGVDIRDPMNPRPDGGGIEGGVQERGAPEIDFNEGQGLVQRGSAYTLDPDTLELIRGQGNRVTYLIDPTAKTRNFYDEHMVAGERLLSSGRFFDAEERFSQALSIRSGDVSAQLGRLHAQIGAGLVMSGSVNLHTLMTEHLEVVSMRYSGQLLPNEQRLRILIENLRVRAGIDATSAYQIPEPVRIRVASGLLIAYLGYQVNDAEQMNAGLGVVRELGSETDRRLVILLDTVWNAVLEVVDDPESDLNEKELMP